MIKELVHDPILLSKKSVDATINDLEVVKDLLDTLIAHKETCVGMAANMIGVHKRIIAFVNDDKTYMTMLNPVILKQELSYDTEEGCLSYLAGPKKCKRYQKIKVQYQNKDMQMRIKTFTGFTAQIIQHEIDHCNGILI
jgi:peptide deformylase